MSADAPEAQMPMLTADTITDAQIEQGWRDCKITAHDLLRALNQPTAYQRWTPSEVRAARGRCAELLNACKRSTPKEQA